MTTNGQSYQSPTVATMPCTEVSLTWASGTMSGFQLLMQHGFFVRTDLGISIRRLLCHQLGVSEDYLDKRINTVFLNGRAVDDVDKAAVSDGSTLALSASMPGLVGAAMRKGGLVAGFRGPITHVQGDAVEERRVGTITVKLYNLVGDELGPAFLGAGILIRYEDARSFLLTRPADFWSDCINASVNGREVDPTNLCNEKLSVPGGLIKLSVVVHRP